MSFIANECGNWRGSERTSQDWRVVGENARWFQGNTNISFGQNL